MLMSPVLFYANKKRVLWSCFVCATIGALVLSLSGNLTVPSVAAEKGAGPVTPPPNPNPPPETIPAAPTPLVRPKLAYLATGSTWNLSTEQFLEFLADFPKAILVLAPAQHLSTDDEFYYYADHRFNLEWAFARKPETNFFIKRKVWSRKVGETAWQERTADATLAAPQ